MGAIGFGWVWVLLLTIPHSVATNFVCESLKTPDFSFSQYSD